MPHNLTEAPSGAILISDSYRLSDLASGVHYESPVQTISGSVSTLDFSGRAVLIFKVTGDLSGSFTFPPLNVPSPPVNYSRSVLLVEFVQDETGNRAIPLDTLFANAFERDGIRAVNPAAGGRTRVRIIVERIGGPVVYRVEYVPYHTHDFTLQDATDFQITSPSADEWLKYDGTAWVNAPLPSGMVPEGYTVVNSLTQLRALTVTPGVPVLLTGYAAVGDGGGGVFHWNASLTPKMVSAATIAAAGTGYTAGSYAILNADANVTSSPNRMWVWIQTVDGSGAVTAFQIVRWGYYTSTVASNPVPTTHHTGTGLTFNITWADLDNDGTIIKSGSTSTGRWVRDFTGQANAKWFGVAETGNAQPAIQRALSYHASVFIPAGTYGLHNPVFLIDGNILEGAGKYATALYGGSDNIGKPIINLNAARLTLSAAHAGERKVRIRNLHIHGYCTTAISVVRGTYCIIDDVWIHNLFNTNHAIIAEDCWNSVFSNLKFTACGDNAASGYTPPANLALIYISKHCSALSFYNIISSSQNAYGIFFNSDVGYGASQLFQNICLQAHTDTAFYIRTNGSGPTFINNFFTENCRISMRLGDNDGNKAARGVSVNGATFPSSTIAQNGPASLWLDFAYACAFTGCTFAYANNKDGCSILLHTVNHGRFYSSYTDGLVPLIDICRRKTTNSRPDVFFEDQERTTGSTHHTVLVMKAASTTNGRMARMWVDGSGVWQNTLVTIAVHPSPT